MAAFLLAFLFAFVPSLTGRAASEVGDSAEKIPCISRQRADSLATHLVVWKGRICPLNTLATDFALRVTGRRRPYGYTPEQVVASWALYPETWNRAPLIRISNKELRQHLHLEGKYASVAQLYDGGRYRLQTLWEQQDDKHTQLCMAINEADECVRLIADLISGKLIQPAPDDAPRPAEWRIQAEILLNRAPFFDILYAATLLLTTVLFVRYIHKKK
mgnify:CR=1 FL=1